VIFNAERGRAGRNHWGFKGLNVIPFVASVNNTSQQDFGTRKFYCVSNVTFHSESKYAIKILPSPTVFVQWPF